MFSVKNKMDRSSQDSTHSISSDSEPEQNLDDVYDRVVHKQGEKQTNAGDKTIEEDGANARENFKDNPGVQMEESNNIPNIMKVQRGGGRIQFQAGTVITNDGTIHGDVHATSKYNVQFHICGNKKSKISMIVSALIILVLVIVVIILQN